VTLQASGRARLRVVLLVVVVFAGLSILLWARWRNGVPPETGKVNPIGQASPTTPTPAATVSAPTVESGTPTPLPIASPGQTPGPVDPGLTPANPAGSTGDLTGSFVGRLKLIIPVVGVRPDQLLDTFTAARSEGRSHDAIDIPAAAGTQVVAVADGEIVKLFQSERGGTTVYQLSSDKQLIFYYAHLQGYASGLAPGKFVRQGEVIAYVGDTGNAGTGNFHLHFSISVVADPKRYWEGTNINPYPLLRK